MTDRESFNPISLFIFEKSQNLCFFGRNSPRKNIKHPLKWTERCLQLEEFQPRHISRLLEANILMRSHFRRFLIFGWNLMVGPRSRQPAIKSPCLSVLAKRQKVGSSIRGTIWRSGHGAGLPIRRSAWKRFEPALAPSAILFFLELMWKKSVQPPPPLLTSKQTVLPGYLLNTLTIEAWTRKRFIFEGSNQAARPHPTNHFSFFFHTLPLEQWIAC